MSERLWPLCESRHVIVHLGDAAVQVKPDHNPGSHSELWGLAVKCV